MARVVAIFKVGLHDNPPKVLLDGLDTQLQQFKSRAWRVLNIMWEKDYFGPITDREYVGKHTVKITSRMSKKNIEDLEGLTSKSMKTKKNIEKMVKEMLIEDPTWSGADVSFTKKHMMYLYAGKITVTMEGGKKSRKGGKRKSRKSRKASRKKRRKGGKRKSRKSRKKRRKGKKKSRKSRKKRRKGKKKSRKSRKKRRKGKKKSRKSRKKRRKGKKKSRKSRKKRRKGGKRKSRKSRRKGKKKSRKSRKASRKKRRKGGKRKSRKSRKAKGGKIPAKYANRPSPPLPANDYCGQVRKGNDGRMYESRMNKNGVCAWKLFKE